MLLWGGALRDKSKNGCVGDYSKLEIHKNSLSRFGVKLCNEIPCHIRDLPKKEFTKVLLSDILKRENDYIEMPLLINKVKKHTNFGASYPLSNSHIV